MDKNRLANIPEKLQKAQKIRMERSDRMDETVYKTIERFQNITLMQLDDFFKMAGKGGKFSRTFLVNSLKRLEKENRIYSRTTEEPIHGKLTKVFFIKSEEPLDVTEIKIVKQPFMGFLEKPLSAYAIKDNMIIISNSDRNDLLEKANFVEPIIIKESDSETIILQLANKFIDFYRLEVKRFYFEKIYESDKIILIRKNILKSSDPVEKKIKKIILLEDNKKFGSTLEDKLKKVGHDVKWFRDPEEFIEYLQKEGKNIDIVSLDMEIDNSKIADKISYEIRHNAPQAKIGLLSDNLEDELEKKKFLDLNFDFVLPKTPNPELGFIDIGDELISWIKAI